MPPRLRAPYSPPPCQAGPPPCLACAPTPPCPQTFTITGGTERYADRGLIPRAISALFAEAAQRTDTSFAVHVSYLVGVGG